MAAKYFLISLFFLSCGTGVKINRTDLKLINTDYSGSFQNHPYKTVGKSYLTRETFPPETLLSHFHILTNTNQVHLTFNSNKQLVLTYTDSIATRASVFDGKFSKKGYYEIVFHQKKIEIPPVIHLLFSRREIDWLRIALTKNNELILDSKHVRDGNFLLVGGGASDRTQNFFVH
jgi:hypothetical protein